MVVHTRVKLATSRTVQFHKWHLIGIVVVQHIMHPSIAHVKEQLDQWCSSQTYHHPICDLVLSSLSHYHLIYVATNARVIVGIQLQLIPAWKPFIR